MPDLQTALRDSIDGEVRFDSISKSVYSVDASIFEVEPIGIVIPKSTSDILKTIHLARKHNVPIIARGAATGITGGCIGKGLVIDTSKYLNNILEINYTQGYVICEPGVVQDRLNEALEAKGYRLGPDTSTGDRATIGGMLANNSAGAHSLKYGKMVDDIISLELLLATGETLVLEEIDNETFDMKCLQEDREGAIYREIRSIQKEYKGEIENRFPNIPRRVSGYNLDELIKPGNLNLAKLIAGSEGTLGIATKIKLRLAKRSVETAVCLIPFENMIDGMRHITKILDHSPIAVEMIDSKILEAGKHAPSMRGRLDWLKGNPEAIFVVEFEGKNSVDLQQRLEKFQSEPFASQGISITDKKQIADIWAVRKAGLGLLLSKRTYSRAIAFIEDLSIPPLQLANFMEEFKTYLKSIGKEAGIYGHVGSGCIHIRPYIDLRSADEITLMKTMMLQITEMVVRYGGALSGEHGDGLIRSWLNKKLFGEKLYEAFCRIKNVFDPHNLMNPNKVVNGPPLNENLRMDENVQQRKIETFLDFTDEGGFELSVDMCNGNGLCRKKEGVMCPSFQASNDEFHSTRARAQSLRAIINGRLPIEELTGKGLYEVMDLCIECKGCKTECPSQIDMAKMKAEFLYQYQEKHGYSLRNRLFGNIPAISSLFSSVASIFNWINDSFPYKYLRELIGITSKRPLPRLAEKRFSTMANLSTEGKKGSVVLFNDTFTEFYDPQIGISAVNVLEALGYHVIIPPWRCCGRPLLSKGFLKEAKEKAVRLIEALYPFAEQGLPIIGLEPSCILTIIDDYLALVGKEDSELRTKAQKVIGACVTFDEFLFQQLQNNNWPFKKSDVGGQKILYHGHCYQKALKGTAASIGVLKALSLGEVVNIPSGCCGMAGSFGYEKEHYAFSLKIANLKLVPTIEENGDNAVVISNGTSCRHQIEHCAKKRPLHLAELLEKHL